MGRFTVMDFPFENESDSATVNRKKYTLLCSSVYTSKCVELLETLNSQHSSDKYADGIKYHEESFFKDKFINVSTLAIQKRSLVFPIRIWTGKELESDCIIIVGLHLKSHTKQAVAVYPILCPTNRFGLWNGNKLYMARAVLPTFWSSFNPNKTDFIFTDEEIGQFSKLLIDYFQDKVKLNEKSQMIEGKFRLMILYLK